MNDRLSLSVDLLSDGVGFLSSSGDLTGNLLSLGPGLLGEISDSEFLKLLIGEMLKSRVALLLVLLIEETKAIGGSGEARGDTTPGGGRTVSAETGTVCVRSSSKHYII